jgi:hypothetical protein
MYNYAIYGAEYKLIVPETNSFTAVPSESQELGRKRAHK